MKTLVNVAGRPRNRRVCMGIFTSLLGSVRFSTSYRLMEVPCTKTNCLDHLSPFSTNSYHLSFSYLQFAAAWLLSTTKQMPGAPELLISNSTTMSPLRNENAI